MGADAGAIARLSRVLVDGRLDAKALDDRQTEIASLLQVEERGRVPTRSELLVLSRAPERGLLQAPLALVWALSALRWRRAGR
jgi:hypothetical protein